MLPFSRMLEYGNEVPNFSGTFESVSYSPIFSNRSECGYCTSSDSTRTWVLGGVQAATFYKDLWRYDSVTDTWSVLASFGTNRSSPGLCYNEDLECLYAFGGSTTQPSIPNQKNDLYKYDIGSNTWSLITPVSSLPPAKLHCTMQYSQGKLYLFGGYETSDLWEFDLSTLVWRELTSAPYLKKYGSNSVLLGTNMYCVGYTGIGASVSYLMQYNIDTGVWNIIDSTSYNIARIAYYNNLLVSLGYENGELYRSDLSTTFVYVSTLSSYPVDNSVFMSTPTGILSVYGKNSGGTSLNAIYRIT